MKSIMRKGIAVLMLLMMVCVFSSMPVFAEAADLAGLIDTIDSAGDSSTASQSAQNIVGAILNVCKVAAVGVALIMLVFIAMKYIEVMWFVLIKKRLPADNLSIESMFVV